jgi:PAS domain S-box-containing protein
MTEKPVRILVIDSNPEEAFAIKESLSTLHTDHFECIHIDSLSEGLESLISHVFDIILLDLSLPDDKGFETFLTLHRASPHIPVITMSRTRDDDLSARVRCEGAYDHLVKGGINSDLLRRSVLAAVKQKHAENHLIRIPDAWERTFDAIPDLIMILDNEHRIIRANKAMAEKLGLSAEKLIGRTCYHTVHGTEKPPLFCPHVRLMSDGSEHSVEVHEELLGGDFLVSVTPLYDPDGTLRGSIHIARDITEIKRTEHALLEKTHELGERIKELHCLFEMSKLREESNASLEETLENIVYIIPPAWQYPDITCARLTQGNCMEAIQRHRRTCEANRISRGLLYRKKRQA